MISGAEFTRAVRRSGLGNKGVAELLGVGLTTVHDYMKTGVRPIRTEEVMQKLGAYLEDGNPLAGFSNLALVAEIARRLDETTLQGGLAEDHRTDEANSARYRGSNGGQGSYEGSGLPPE